MLRGHAWLRRLIIRPILVYPDIVLAFCDFTTDSQLSCVILCGYAVLTNSKVTILNGVLCREKPDRWCIEFPAV